MFFFFLSIVFINLFVYYGSYIYLTFLLACMYLLAKKVDVKLFIVSAIMISIFFTIRINYYKDYTISNTINNSFTILESYEKYSIVGEKNIKYLIYNNNNVFKEGNVVLFKGTLKNIENTNNDFYNYLNKNNIKYELTYYSHEIQSKKINLRVSIIDKLLSTKSEASKSYLKLILFNVKEENNKDLYNNFSLYSLTYLIAVSGFHINLLLSFCKKIFHNNIIGILIVSFYLYLLNFSVSIYRAFLCYIFKNINRKIKFNISSLDIISLIGSSFIIINPSILFSFSFIYSFLASFLLEIFKVYKPSKFKIALYIYLTNLPLLLLNYYKLNVFSLLFSMLLSPLVSFLYIFSFIFLFLDKFYLLYELVISLLFKLFAFINKFNIILTFGKPSIYFIIIYYLLLIHFFVLKERKSKIKLIYAFLILLLLGYQYYKPILTYEEQVYFLNVGQGDCIVFFIPHSKEVVLVDTGGSKYKDIAKNEIIPFLESKGINKINQVILTHDDFDHIGALDNLKNNFPIENIIDSSLIPEIKIGNKIFKNLNITSNRDNEGSIVLYGQYGGYNLLLMGDATIEVENIILNNINQVDIIKIGHHGSNTSSDYNFLEKINAKIAVISVGANNTYGHPHKEVLDNLSKLNYIVLRTDKNNDIGFGKNIFNLSFVDYDN